LKSHSFPFLRIFFKNFLHLDLGIEGREEKLVDEFMEHFGEILIDVDQNTNNQKGVIALKYEL
jgi:hypothetical protein